MNSHHRFTKWNYYITGILSRFHRSREGEKGEGLFFHGSSSDLTIARWAFIESRRLQSGHSWHISSCNKHLRTTNDFGTIDRYASEDGSIKGVLTPEDILQAHYYSRPMTNGLFIIEILKRRWCFFRTQSKKNYQYKNYILML